LIELLTININYLAASASQVTIRRTEQYLKEILTCSKYGFDRSHMSRSILTVLLATILAISHLSINPTPSACQSLFIIFHHIDITACSYAGQLQMLLAFWL